MCVCVCVSVCVCVCLCVCVCVCVCALFIQSGIYNYRWARDNNDAAENCFVKKKSLKLFKKISFSVSAHIVQPKSQNTKTISVCDKNVAIFLNVFIYIYLSTYWGEVV